MSTPSGLASVAARSRKLTQPRSVKADEYAQDDTNGSYAGLGDENDHDVEQKIMTCLVLIW